MNEHEPLSQLIIDTYDYYLEKKKCGNPISRHIFALHKTMNALDRNFKYIIEFEEVRDLIAKDRQHRQLGREKLATKLRLPIWGEEE